MRELGEMTSIYGREFRANNSESAKLKLSSARLFPFLNIECPSRARPNRRNARFRLGPQEGLTAESSVPHSQNYTNRLGPWIGLP
jgi:hypothetical protein